MYSVNYHRATSVADAASKAKGEAKYLAGGMTLIPTMKQRLAQPGDVIDLMHIGELKGIKVEGKVVTIGAGTTHAEVAASAAIKAVCPALCHLASHIGDPHVRHRGTIGGSIANNDPSACYPAAVLASGAVVVTNTREIAADDYFQGLFETALHDGEIITAVRFPIPQKAAYAKFLQPASRFALTGAFVAQYAGGVRVAITGASEGGVFRWTEAETALSADFSPAAIAGKSASADGMIGDLHGTPAYRAHLVGVMTRRAVAAAH